MFSARAGVMGIRKINETHIIFKSTALDLGSGTMNRETIGI